MSEKETFYTMALIELEKRGIKENKAIFREGELVTLWSAGGESVTLKRDRNSRFVNLCYNYQREELNDTFTVGLVEHDNDLVKVYLLNGEPQYRWWADRTQKYLKHRRTLGRRRQVEEANVANAMWVTEPMS